MGRTPAPTVGRRLSAAERRVLTSFLCGRLPAGQLDSELARARTQRLEALAVGPAAAQAQPVPAIAT